MRNIGGIFMAIGLLGSLYHYWVRPAFFNAAQSAIQATQIYTQVSAGLLFDIALILVGVGFFVASIGSVEPKAKQPQ